MAQDSTDDTSYDAALAKHSHLYTPPTIEADWAQDGYGGAGTIDDLTDLAGRPIEVEHFLDDSLPAAVTMPTGLGVGQVSVPLVAGPNGETGVQYFSPLQSSSALAGYQRDVAPVRIKTNLVTEAGPLPVTVFTGQMAATPISGRRAELKALSAARFKLTKYVQPPVVTRSDSQIPAEYGLTAAWPVAWTLHQCGIYPSPPAASGCRLWLPMHGGGYSYLPDDFQPATPNSVGFMASTARSTGDAAARVDEEQVFTDGPYVGAVLCENSSTFYRRSVGVSFDNQQLEAGSDWLTTAGNRGRVSFWVKGDAIDLSTVIGGTADLAVGVGPSPTSAMLAGMGLPNMDGVTGVYCGVDLNRHVYVDLSDSSSTRTIFSSATTVLTDDYNRTTAGGLGTADTGQSYTLSGGVAGDFSTTTAGGGHADIDTNTVATNYWFTADVGTADQELSTNIRVGSLPATGTWSIGLAARHTDASNYYRAELQVTTTGAMTLRLIRRSGGSDTTLTSVLTSFTYAANALYTLRVQVIGSTIRAKVWLASARQPSTWDLECFDASPLATGSRAGGYCRNDTAATTHIFTWESLRVLDLSQGRLPSDSAFHFVGCAWDVANNKLWLRLDSTLYTSTPSPALSAAALPTTHATGEVDFDVEVFFALTAGELQFVTGSNASPDVSSTWINDAGYFTQTATVTPSQLELEVLAIDQPIEAWTLIGDFAQSEFAALRVDELDHVLYLSQPYWAATARQTVQETLTAGDDSDAPNVFYDPTKIRNAVRMNYTQTLVDAVPSAVISLDTPLPIAPGVTLAVLATSVPAVKVRGGRMIVLTQAEIEGTVPSPLAAGGFVSYVSFNTLPDGSGAYSYDTSSNASYGVDVIAEILSWTPGQVLVQFTNYTSTTYYTANDAASFDVDLRALAVYANAVQQNQASEVAAETDSITTRGERGLTITSPRVQTADMAQRFAALLVGDLADPVTEITDLELPADSRRQPGDLVSYSDALNSGASGYWRYRGIKHTIDGGGHRQSVSMRRARRTSTWSTGLWNDAIWGA